MSAPTVVLRVDLVVFVSKLNSVRKFQLTAVLHFHRVTRWSTCKTDSTIERIERRGGSGRIGPSDGNGDDGRNTTTSLVDWTGGSRTEPRNGADRSPRFVPVFAPQVAAKVQIMTARIAS